MKRYIKNRYNVLIINFFTVLFCSSFIIAIDKIDFSFDSLFPMTWYQKGLESSLSAWQVLLQNTEKNYTIRTPNKSLASGQLEYKKNECYMPLFDILLARLCFTQFCINRMMQNHIKSLPEDVAYFSMALKKVKDLIQMIGITDQNEDFILCLQEMVGNIQKQIAQLP